MRGIHFHSSCDSTDFGPLLRTVKRLSRKLERFLGQVSWVNLGGGYLFSSPAKVLPLVGAVNLLSERYGTEVFVQPGAALVRGALVVIAMLAGLLVR